jgi:hypothetical protein
MGILFHVVAGSTVSKSKLNALPMLTGFVSVKEKKEYCHSCFPLKPNTLEVPGLCWRQRNNRKPPVFHSLALGPLSNPSGGETVSPRVKFNMIISFCDSLNWKWLVQQENLLGHPCSLHSPTVGEWCCHVTNFSDQLEAVH